MRRSVRNTQAGLAAFLTSYLPLCLLLIGLAQSSPLPLEASESIAARAANKRVVSWEWTLTRDLAAYPAIQKSANALGPPKRIVSIMNWETWRPNELPKGLVFRPMVRTPAQLAGQDWANLLANIPANSPTQNIVHFYNEPERQPVSVADAVARWRSKMLPLRANRNAKLVSPACASDAAGTAWLNKFMAALGPNEKPDFVGLHFYTARDAAAATAVPNAKKYINDRHSRFGLPVIVSEIASTNRNAAQVEAFTKQMANWMDGVAWIREYGFFGVSRVPTDDFVSPAAQLLNVQGAWTALGKWLAGL